MTVQRKKEFKKILNEIVENNKVHDQEMNALTSFQAQKQYTDEYRREKGEQLKKSLEDFEKQKFNDLFTLISQAREDIQADKLERFRDSEYQLKLGNALKIFENAKDTLSREEAIMIAGEFRHDSLAMKALRGTLGEAGERKLLNSSLINATLDHDNALSVIEEQLKTSINSPFSMPRAYHEGTQLRFNTLLAVLETMGDDLTTKLDD